MRSLLANSLLSYVRNYHVRVTTKELSFGYSADCVQKTVDRAQIQHAEVVERINGLCDWGGYFIRKQLPSWETGYIPKNGSGVRMIMRNSNGKEQAYTFICDEPETVVRILTG